MICLNVHFQNYFHIPKHVRSNLNSFSWYKLKEHWITCCIVAFHNVVVFECGHFNSLWPGDTIWQHKSGSTLDQVMAWCLTAPTHYLNQCWLIIKGVLWHSPERNFTGNAQDINSWNEFEFTISKLFPHFPGANELNDKLQCLLQLFWCWGLLLKCCDKNH